MRNLLGKTYFIWELGLVWRGLFSGHVNIKANRKGPYEREAITMARASEG